MFKPLLYATIAMLSANAYAQCQQKITQFYQQPANKHQSYDMFGNNPFPLSQTYVVKVTNTGTEQCQSTLIIKPQSNALTNAVNQQLRFEINNLGTPSRRFENGLALSVPRLEPGQNKEMQFSLKFPKGQYVRSGRFSQHFDIYLTQAKNIGQQLDERREHLTANVEQSARISLWGIGGANRYTVDFGTMTSNKELILQPKLLVQSSTDYKLEISSDNRGKMRHAGGNPEWDVNYDFFLDNQRINLNSTTFELLERQPENAVGHRYSMRFKLGDVSRRPAGNYNDSIKINITPSLAP
ncbi:hypothetical protein [Thaumasiovibrio sp. DFM-14]|uniref:hypothetical protein n=1 Tax=Thaumasiovibrio sp. DFM-14 TaxID=3384792 RepID=UPI00399EEADB